jgi:hypothetical protein
MIFPNGQGFSHRVRVYHTMGKTLTIRKYRKTLILIASKLTENSSTAKYRLLELARDRKSPLTPFLV